MTDGHINTFHTCVLLTDDGVNTDRRLTDLPVADDQFTLAAADRGHCINSLQSGIHGLVNRLTLDHAGRNHFNAPELCGFNGSFAVDRSARGINDASQNRLTNGNLSDFTGSLDDVAFLDMRYFTQNGNTDVIGFQIQHHSQDAAGELQ